MVVDARTVPKNTVLETDVCIIGAGAAGITLAREFAGKSFKVCLLESGGLEYEWETQELYKGQNVGVPYFPLETARLRFFGGTTNHWTGTCRPLDDIDFKKRDWVPHSGWPFERAELLPYYRRAQVIMQLGPFVYSEDDWDDKRKIKPVFDGTLLTSAIYQQSPPTRFGQVYRDEILRAGNITTYLHANVLEFESHASGQSIKRARVTSLEQNPFTVSARKFVLATGGIENPRLLLLSNKVHPRGLGNDHDLVGRFFMDHPIVGDGQAGVVALMSPTEYSQLLADRKKFKNFDSGGIEPPLYWYFVAPTQNGMRRERLLNCGIGIELPDQPDAPGINAARHIRELLFDAKWPEHLWEDISNVISDFGNILGAISRNVADPLDVPLKVSYWAESTPNPDSRVYLSNERDRLGQRRVVLDWRMTELDTRTFRRSLNLLAVELGRHGLGRLGVNPDVWGEDWGKLAHGSWHHCGTTRMHADPRHGVVDPNCRVHGISNLYIAGSSVFPTIGQTTPTMTIVALALRLADHIKAQMR